MSLAQRLPRYPRGAKQAKNHVLTSHVLFFIKELICFTLLALASSYLHKIPPSTFIRLDLQFSFIVSFRITLQMFYICINQY